MEETRREILSYLAILIILTIAATAIMNVEYRYVIAPLFGIVGVLTYRVLMHGAGEPNPALGREKLLESAKHLPLVLHILVIALWILVPSSTSLFYVGWLQLSALLVLRGIVSFTYALFVPGTLLVELLDTKGRLSRLELVILGFLSSVFFTSLVGYGIFTLRLDLASYTLPIIWTFATLLLAVRIFTRKFTRNRFRTSLRPSSFPFKGVEYLIVGVLALLLTAILVINISWRVLLAGDLWTHAAQTAYFLQGTGDVNYPWAYHFLAASIHAVSGLPVVNVLQLIQFLAVMPILALYATATSLVGRKEPRIPALATVFFATFMGLGWISYLWLRGTTSPTGSPEIFGVELIASQLTYDIIEGIGAYRVAMIPASIAISALIYGLRLLRGFELSRPTLSVASFILTALMLQSHIFEAGFFTAVFAVSTFLLWDSDYRKTLALTGVGSALGFAWVYLLDYVSPPSQQLFGSFQGAIFFSGFQLALTPLLAGLLVLAVKGTLTRERPEGFDVVRRLYSSLGARLPALEKPTLRLLILTCAVLGVVFGIYSLVSPVFFVWDAAETGYVPLNLYPIRIGVVTFFALVGSLLLILRETDLRRLFEFLSLAVVALVVGRLVYLLGSRPQGFGENRVFDFLWIGVVVLGAYGFVRLIPHLEAWLGRTQVRRQLVGLFMILLVFVAGASSFLVFVDAYVESSRRDFVPSDADMMVLSYIVTHRSSLLFSLSAPTMETSYVIRKLTLNPSYGYSNPFRTPSIFTSTTLPNLLAYTATLSNQRVFLRGNDIAYLGSNGYSLTLWYLAYQSAVVDAETSFLLAPRRLNLPSGGSISVLHSQSPTMYDFYLVSAVALTNTPYSIIPFNGVVTATSPYVLLTHDPANASAYQSGLSWANSTGGTLAVVSNANTPGMFERVFFGSIDQAITFGATNLNGTTGGSMSSQLPFPIEVHGRAAPNATVIAQYHNLSAAAPLSYSMTYGAGRIILIMLRDYYQMISINMFTNPGRALYNFLPTVLRISGIPVTS